MTATARWCGTRFRFRVYAGGRQVASEVHATETDLVAAIRRWRIAPAAVRVLPASPC